MTRRKPREPRPAVPTAETFVPSVSFTGYPDGVSAVEFKAGVESPPVSPEYAELIRAKGFVADI